jgi:hypothetical protein
MLQFDAQQGALSGPHGQLTVPPTDEVTYKMAMLIVGECLGLGPIQAAQAFGYTKQRYFQLRDDFAQHGASALVNQKSGPKCNFRCTDAVIKEVVRHRFLDPDASAYVIAQKIRQTGLPISTRSVERIIANFGLQKKTASLPAEHSAHPGSSCHPEVRPRGGV